MTRGTTESAGVRNDGSEDLAARLAEAERTVENLTRALGNSRRIGAAIGILMATRKVTEDDAFELLRTTSQNCGRKLRDVADNVVLTGTL